MAKSEDKFPPSYHSWRRKKDRTAHNEALPDKAFVTAFEAPVIQMLLGELVVDRRGVSSLSEVTSLPPAPPKGDAGYPQKLPLSHPWTYPTVRRLLRLAHATKDRPEDGPHFRDAVVSERERELLFEWRPLLRSHDGFRGFAQHLIHHTFRTEKEGEILASKGLVRRSFGLDPDGTGGALPHDARALELLWLYTAFIDNGLRWSGYHSSGNARTIKEHDTPTEIVEEARKPARRSGGKSIGLLSGSNYGSYWRGKQLDEMLGRAEKHEPKVRMPDATRKIVNYHNQLVQDRGGKNMFTSLAKKAEVAEERLKSGMEQADDDGAEGIEASIRRVRAFENLPRPIYRSADYTPRPVSVGGNHPMQLPGEVLQSMFTWHYVYLDGSKIQLALFEKLARDAGVSCPTIRDHLQRHLDGEFDLWSEIGSAIDLPDGSARRQAAKRATYAALYFSGEPNLHRVLCSEYGKATSMDGWADGEDVEGFFTHPVIDELLSARDTMEKVLAEKGGMEDAFGIERAVEDFEDRSNPKRTLLSCVLQGHELKLMEPLYDVAIEEQERARDDRFRIAIYKYDGIVVWIREGQRDRDRDNWIGSLQKAFNDEAEDVLSRLDVEQVGPPKA